MDIEIYDQLYLATLLMVEKYFQHLVSLIDQPSHEEIEKLPFGIQ